MTNDDKNAGIAKRAVSGSAYSIASSAVTILLGLIRSILLARFLLPEHFGVASLALFFLNLSSQLRGFGLDNAIIQRKKIDDKVLATYFTMRQGTVVLSLGLLAAFVPLIGRYYPEYNQLIPVLYAFIGISLIKGFNLLQITILNKRMAFRFIAITNAISSIAMTIVAPTLAWLGWGVWSLVMETLVGISVNAIAIWVFYRPWKPRLGWDKQIARELWSFGIKLWWGSNIAFILDRFDDFWTGTFLGKTPLGYYDRAYEFANYPKKVIANPIVPVFFSTFSRLQDDRTRLSRAFFRATSLMVRTGFWFSLIFVLAAPEGIELFIEAKWLPMITTFQLMIIYTMLDPLLSGANSLLIAVGQPGLIVRSRLIQLVVFVPSVILLASWSGIEGVAIAADLMIATGAVFLFRHVGRYVDYSRRALWGWPTVAFLLVAGITLLLTPVWSTLSLWLSLMGKGFLISVVYWGILWLTEREELMRGGLMIWGLVSPGLQKVMGKQSK